MPNPEGQHHGGSKGERRKRQRYRNRVRGWEQGRLPRTEKNRKRYERAMAALVQESLQRPVE